MDADRLAADYPLLYHMAEAGSWPSIRKHGLLSTSALLDRCGVDQKERARIESRIRRKSVPIECGRLGGTAVIRDQKPLHEHTLRKLLTDMTVPEFCRMLNGRTFFWTSTDRLKTMLNAREYKDREHDVITVDTAGLVGAHHDEIALSRINSGATSRGRGKRGSGTFVRIPDYPYSVGRRYGGCPVVELAVDYRVADVRRHVVRVESWKGCKKIRTILEGSRGGSRR